MEPCGALVQEAEADPESYHPESFWIPERLGTLSDADSDPDDAQEAVHSCNASDPQGSTGVQGSLGNPRKPWIFLYFPGFLNIFGQILRL